MKLESGVGSYWFGFNGKERDSDLGGGQTAYDYGFRIYNPGIGKFLSVDPLTASYPWYTPYQFAGNMPIQAIDVDGLEPAIRKTDGYWTAGGDNLSSSSTPPILKKPTAVTVLPEIQSFLSNNPHPKTYEQQKTDYRIHKLEVARAKFNNSFTDFEKAGHLGVEIAGTVEGGIGLYKLAKSAPGILRSYLKASPKMGGVNEPHLGGGIEGELVLSNPSEHPFVSRSDSRSPEDIFIIGFELKNPKANKSLVEHTEYPNGSYIGTTSDPTIIVGDYEYVIRNNGTGFDVNKSYPGNLFPWQKEIAFPNNISKSDVLGAYKMNNGARVGDLIPNPHYVP